MSTTYSLVCDDCKVSYWSSQTSCGGPANWYDLEAVGRFLVAHQGHRLRYLHDYTGEIETQLLDYAEVKP